MSEEAKCALCGEPMPPGEEMFKYHGYSCECPKPPLPKPSKDEVTIPRAQYEALMGAAKILPSILFDYGDDDVRREAYAAIAALRSAGIEET